MSLNLFIGIDYSGAETPTSRLKGLQVFATTEGPPRRVIAVPEEGKTHWNWSRREIANYLIELAGTDAQFIAALDHGFSFPLSYMQRYGLTSWDAFLADFVQHWPTHDPYTYVDFIRDRLPPRTGESSELRICERWTSSAKSVFRFDVQGQVAKSTHAGIPWLWHIRKEVGNRVHFWPFDGWDVPEGKSVIVEVYPSIFRNRYLRGERTVDEQDAYSVARWLYETYQNGVLDRYLHPALTDRDRQIAELEGWILGIA